MIIITGGAGFIGSNLIKKLNKRNENKIIIVDDLNHFNKIKNLSNLDFYDYIDIKEFYNNVSTFKKDIKAIFHQGACADTTVTDINMIYCYNIFMLNCVCLFVFFFCRRRRNYERNDKHKLKLNDNVLNSSNKPKLNDVTQPKQRRNDLHKNLRH